MKIAPPAPTKRTQAVLAYQSLVRSVAIRVSRTLPGNVDLGDLISEGLMGLLDAVERYDPERGVPFNAYAELRIRGAIIDHLRSTSWAPRSAVRKARELADVRQALERRLGRPPLREEVALQLNLTPTEYDEVCAQAILERMVPGDQPLGEGGSETVISILPSRATLPEDRWIRGELRAEVRAAIRRLPEREALVIEQYYLQGLPLKQIALGLGVTEGRVSQLGKRALERLQTLVYENPTSNAESESSAPPEPRSVAERQALLVAWSPRLNALADALTVDLDAPTAARNRGILLNRGNVALLEALEGLNGPCDDAFTALAEARAREAMTAHLGTLEARKRSANAAKRGP